MSLAPAALPCVDSRGHDPRFGFWLPTPVLSSGRLSGELGTEVELEGKRALVTGGAVRLGRAIARRLARSGCDLALHYHHSIEAAQEARGELEGFGVQCVSLQANLAEPAQCEKLLVDASAALGGVELVVHNAAIFPPEGFVATDLGCWERVMAVNLRAPFLLSRAFAQALPERAEANLVFVTDARVGRAQRGAFAYQVAKAGLEEMTRLLAVELAPTVRVNAVAPGAMLEARDEDREALLARVTERVPLARAGGAEAVAEAVLYLLEAEFATGTVLRLDGGEYL